MTHTINKTKKSNSKVNTSRYISQKRLFEVFYNLAHEFHTRLLLHICTYTFNIGIASGRVPAADNSKDNSFGLHVEPMETARRCIRCTELHLLQSKLCNLSYTELHHVDLSMRCTRTKSASVLTGTLFVLELLCSHQTFLDLHIILRFLKCCGAPSVM
jgi:hypothetical protein